MAAESAPSGLADDMGALPQMRGHIFPRYLIIELLTGALAAVMAWLYAPLVALALIIAIALMLICALTDLEKMLLHLPVMLALGGNGHAGRDHAVLAGQHHRIHPWDDGTGDIAAADQSDLSGVAGGRWTWQR